MKYQVHTRSQHSRGSSHGKFGGPDTYVAVTAAPEGADVPHVLNQNVLAARGIKIRYFGGDTRSIPGPGSVLGKALREAHEYVREMEAAQAQQAVQAA